MPERDKIDDIPSMTTPLLIQWLWNKWARHGEIEDGVAARRLELLAAKLRDGKSHICAIEHEHRGCAWCRAEEAETKLGKLSNDYEQQCEINDSLSKAVLTQADRLDAASKELAANEERFQAARDAWDMLTAMTREDERVKAHQLLLDAISGVRLVKPDAETMEWARKVAEELNVRDVERRSAECGAVMAVVAGEELRCSKDAGHDGDHCHVAPTMELPIERQKPKDESGCSHQNVKGVGNQGRCEDCGMELIRGGAKDVCGAPCSPQIPSMGIHGICQFAPGHEGEHSASVPRYDPLCVHGRKLSEECGKCAEIISARTYKLPGSGDSDERK